MLQGMLLDGLLIEKREEGERERFSVFRHRTAKGTKEDSVRSPQGSIGRLEESSVTLNEETSAEHDKKLVARVKAGDTLAFKELVEKYQSRAHSIALGVISNRDDADDIVQEAFLKCYRNLDSFRGQSSFYTWFYRIVFNLSIDLSRKRYRRSESSVGDSGAIDALNLHSAEDAGHFVGSTPGPEQVLERVGMAQNIKKAISDLSDEHRAVIVLREIEGLSYSEISDVVGCSKGTVMSRLHHARKRLQKVLAPILPEHLRGEIEEEEKIYDVNARVGLLRE